MVMKFVYHLSTSYWDWFESEDYFKSRLSDIFFICFQSSLAEDFEILKLKLGLPDNAVLPNNDNLANRGSTDLDRTLTDEAIDNLKRWYKNEFKFIALCEEIIREHPALRDSRPVKRS